MAEIDLGLVPVVSAAPELDVVYRKLATHSMGPDVMELEETLLGTAAAVASYEGAAPAVAEPDRSPDIGRDVSRARDMVAAPAWTIGGSKLLLGQVLEEHRQRPVEDRRRITVWNLMTQEVLRESELPIRFSPHRELHLITFWRQWDD